MPDLSGRDSNSDSQNIYGLKEDEVASGDISFCFELVKDIHEYAAKAFDFQPPPAIEVKEGSVEYPGPAASDSARKSEITISKEGIDKEHIGEYKFFLSPILPPGSSTTTRGLRTTDRGVEIFTAPVITKPYIKDETYAVVEYSKEVTSKLIYEFSVKIQNDDMSGYNKVFNNTKDIGKKETSSSKDLTKIDFAEASSKTPSKHSYSLVDLGLPLSENLSSLNIDSAVDVLGEINRPEILMGFRDGGPADQYNEARFYDPRVYSAKTLLASNRPNIITDLEDWSQLPPIWIPLKYVAGKKEDDFFTLEAPYIQTASKGPKSSLDIYNNMGLLKFALYAVDHMGQIVRAPGKNISITPNTPILKNIEPSGYGGQGAQPINLGTTISPGLFELSDNTLTGINFTESEGVSGLSKELVLNFYSDKEGTNLLASVRDGDKYGKDGHEIKIRDVNKHTISLDTKATIGDILPALVGTYYVGVQLPTGVTSPLIPLYVSKAGTKKDDLPVPEDVKITFFDSFGLEVEGFDEGVHSIPIIQDAVNNASISIKSEKKTFVQGEDAVLFAYIAVLKDEDNKNEGILLSDLGWINNENHKKDSVLPAKIKTIISPDGADFYIPTALEWRYGEGNFKRNNARKVTLKFPGTDHTDFNLSRFTELSAKGSKEHPAYIILTNSELSSGTTNPATLMDGGKSEKGGFSYAVIPIGKAGHPGDLKVERPAFAPVPEILGFVAKLPSDGGESTVVSNIPKASLESSDELKSSLDGLSIESIKSGNNQNFTVITSDALERLAVVFRGSNVSNMEKMHKASIGNKNLKDNCTSIEYIGNNMVVANYKDITGIKAQGWTDVVIEKTDKRFKCSYDSTLYNKVTIDINPKEGEEKFRDEDGKLLTKKDLLLTKVKENKFVDGRTPKAGEPGPAENMSTVIFPGGNGEFTPLPLIKNLSYPVEPTKKGEAPDSQTFYQFANPVKVKPSLDLVFGTTKNIAGTAKVIGMALTDSLVEDGVPITEIIAINKNGHTTVAMGLEDMADALKKAKEEAQAVIDNIKKSIEKIKDATLKKQKEQELAQAEANFQEQSKNTDEAIEKAQTSLTKEEADAAAFEAAKKGAQAAGSQASDSANKLEGAMNKAGEAAAAAGAAVGEALGAINDALSMFKTVSDALSSIADIANQIASGVEGAVSSLGSRPDDFIKTDIKYVYIDKDTTINSNSFKVKDDKSQFKLTTNFKFSQTSAIKFNTPEIVEVRKPGKDEPWTPFGDNPYAKLKIKTGETLLLRTIGAKRDTKIEIAGKRATARPASPFQVGIFQDFEVTVPDMTAFSLFGTGDCISITASNSNDSRMRLGRQMGNDLTLKLDEDWNSRIFDDRNKEGPGGDLAKHLEDNAYLKFLMVKLGKVAGGAKESLQSFCDFSFHLTAELSLQLRNFRVLLVPIKVIFCIIDVICALLNPWRLAFAIIRLFLCLYDLILLLPQLAVPAMFLALLLHLLNLLLCVILKILSWVNAINEIITALARAIEHKNYPAIAALEEAINEHLFSLETDISVLEPIITILNLFLQLLQLAFAFPCRVGSDDDDEACIDPSQLAGIILGKVAPTGAIAPNVLLPLAQAYTRLPPQDSGYYGNSPPEQRDNKGNVSVGGPLARDIDGGVESNQVGSFDVVVRPQDENNAIVARQTPDVGANIPNMMNMATGEMKTIQEGGFFRADFDGDGNMDNINYPQLRTFHNDPQNPGGADDFHGGPQNDTYYGANAGYFDATFSLSYTKGTKDWGFFTGPDPRLVRFNFDSGGVTSDIAWWTWWLIFPIFWSKKRVGTMQTIDSRPMFLKKNEDGDLTVSKRGNDFVSPIDGFDNFLTKVGSGYQPKPLTVTFELNEPGVNMETFDAEFTPVMVTKTFGNIPMIAIVDDEFNVYFVEKDGTNGGIRMSGSSIDSIHLKMLNKPSAPKHKTSRQKEIAYSDRWWRDFDSFKAETSAWLAELRVDGDGNAPNGSTHDWDTNTSSEHDVKGWPSAGGGSIAGHGHLSVHPVTGERKTTSNYYTTDGPKLDPDGNLDEEFGQPEWSEYDGKYGVSRTGEAIMQSTANAMWLKGETLDSEPVDGVPLSGLHYNGVPVADILGRNADNGDGVPADNAPIGSTSIEYLLSTISKYRYNKALHCIWGHEPFETSSLPDPHVVGSGHYGGAGGNIPTDSAVHNPNNIDYTAYPEKRIQTLKNKVVTLFLSTEEESSSPYENISDEKPSGDPWVTDDDDREWGDPYWPVNYGDMGTEARNTEGATGESGVYGGDNGMVEIHILDEADMYDGVSGTPGRFEVKWTEEMDQNIPYPKLGMAYDHGGGSTWEQGDIGDAITAVKVYDFPQFYIVDMRQLADDIAAACGASGPAELLLDLPGFEEPFEEVIDEVKDCLQKFMDAIKSADIDENGEKKGFIDRIRDDLAAGTLPSSVDIQDILGNYEELVECVKNGIDESCKFVVNPLNTGFKLLEDLDESPLPKYINPEQEDLEDLLSFDIVDENEFDTDLQGFPQITGAMEYASGIGDTAIIEVESKAVIELLPRDSNDDPMPSALDLTEKIEIEFVSDQTGNAELVTPYESTEELTIKDEEKYFVAVTAQTPGKVVVKGSVCGVVIQAVTDRGIISGLESASAEAEEEIAESLEGCIEDAIDDGLGESSEAEDDTFAPGALMKVDRTLTILFVPKGAAGAGGGGMGGPGGLYGDGDREASARSAKPSPQTSGTKLEN
jgi:hypothetical protein